MKKLTLKLDDLAVDSFQATADEKASDGTVDGYQLTAVGGSCAGYETCGVSCRETCRRCPV